MPRYCEKRLARDPGDQAARWTLLAGYPEAGLFSGLDLLASEVADGVGPPYAVEPERARRARERIAAARTLLAEDPDPVVRRRR